MTTVLLVDDHAAIRAGVRMILETAQQPCQVLAEAGSAERGVELARIHQPDVVLLDIRMPGNSGLSVIHDLRESGAAVIMLSSFALDEYVIAALEAGADGFLVKSAEPEEILGAVHRVANGDAVLSSQVLRSVIRRAVGEPGTSSWATDHLQSRPQPQQTTNSPGAPQHPDLGEPLTPREQDVLRLVADGYSNHDIAKELVVSESTVKTHVSHVLAKLQVSSRVQAALWWGRHGAR